MNFLNRHVGNSKNQILKILNLSEKEIISKVIPANILGNFRDFPQQSENQSLRKLENIMAKNKIYHSMIGLDFSESIVPGVIKRNKII